MKRMIVAFGICLLAWIPCRTNAQNNAPELRNRIQISYGDALYTSFATDLFQGLIGGMVFADGAEINTSGAYTLGYRRVSGNARWTFGADLGYFRINETLLGVKSSHDLVMVMPAAACYYKRHGLVRFYGTASVGGIFSSGGSGFAFQFNPIAIRVGNDRIAGFVEAGVGYKGVFNLGLEVGF